MIATGKTFKTTCELADVRLLMQAQLAAVVVLMPKINENAQLLCRVNVASVFSCHAQLRPQTGRFGMGHDDHRHGSPNKTFIKNHIAAASGKSDYRTSSESDFQQLLQQDSPLKSLRVMLTYFLGVEESTQLAGSF